MIVNRIIMRATPFRYLLTAALAGGLFAQAPAARPRYEVKRASSRISVDGKLDEKAWQAANTIVFIFPWEAQTGAKQKTTARLLWDAQNLYVSYECEDADITAQFTERDDPTYRDDAVEIFINPRPSQTDVYLGLEMNARATLYDYVSFLSARYLFKRFQLQGVQLATSIDGTLNMRGDTDKGWTLELAIPWANFEELSRRPPEAGAVWSATLNRWDGVEPNRRLSMWMDPGDRRPSPHHPEKFGELVFVE
jgi:hypothetical protein